MFTGIACIVMGTQFGSTAAIVLGILQIVFNVISWLIRLISKD